jgi:hypothetical protein
MRSPVALPFSQPLRSPNAVCRSRKLEPLRHVGEPLRHLVGALLHLLGALLHFFGFLFLN